MKRSLFVLFLALLQFPVLSQDILGKNRESVVSLIRQDHPEFRMRNPPNVKEMNFYKFEHASGDITLIAFFGNDGLCGNYQLVYDSEMIEEILEELDKSCQKKGEKEWICNEYKKKLLVTLIEDEWFFTLNKKPIK